MTTITRLKQLRDQLEGKLLPQRLERKKKAQEAQALAERIDQFNRLLTQNLPIGPITFSSSYSNLDRFTSYREKIVPQLRESGYGYFMACDSKRYQEHQEWCNDNCQDHSLPHCDVWQVDSRYPRAFANKIDAAVFRLMFDSELIEGDEEF